MSRVLGAERPTRLERRERTLWWQPQARFCWGQELLGPWGECATRDQRAEPHMIAWRHNDFRTRAEEIAPEQVVVARIANTVICRDRWRKRDGIEGENLADVSAPIGNVSERKQIAAVVPLGAVRQSDVELVSVGAALPVRACEHPRRDVRLRDCPAHVPVGGAERSAHA